MVMCIACKGSDEMTLRVRWSDGLTPSTLGALPQGVVVLISPSSEISPHLRDAIVAAPTAPDLFYFGRAWADSPPAHQLHAPLIVRCQPDTLSTHFFPLAGFALPPSTAALAAFASCFAFRASESLHMPG